jgi:hypothetical protein
MDLPASLREINPVIDQLARGEAPCDGAALRLAMALGLVTPERSLTEAGRAYACPALAGGPVSLVMSAERRAAAQPLVGGARPLQGSLRRLLRRIAVQGNHLVSPIALGWPEGLLRPFLAYLEDLGLLVPIGPLVEVTVQGWVAVGRCDPTPQWAPWVPPGAGAGHRSGFTEPAFQYYLVREACLSLVALRGRRDWHHLGPLLDGPLAGLKPAYNEWLARFQTAQPSMRRSWSTDLVHQFAALRPTPEWFPRWCHALLGARPGDAVDSLAACPALLCKVPVLSEGPLSREVWLVAAALDWAARRGRCLKYEAAAERFRLDGILLPPWPAMHEALEQAGLLVTGTPDVRLLLPVEVQAPVEALWPYAGPEWVAAALLEGGAFAVAAGVRRPARV